MVKAPTGEKISTFTTRNHKPQKQRYKSKRSVYSEKRCNSENGDDEEEDYSNKKCRVAWINWKKNQFYLLIIRVVEAMYEQSPESLKNFGKTLIFFWKMNPTSLTFRLLQTLHLQSIHIRTIFVPNPLPMPSHITTFLSNLQKNALKQLTRWP